MINRFWLSRFDIVLNYIKPTFLCILQIWFAMVIIYANKLIKHL